MVWKPPPTPTLAYIHDLDSGCLLYILKCSVQLCKQEELEQFRSYGNMIW